MVIMMKNTILWPRVFKLKFTDCFGLNFKIFINIIKNTLKGARKEKDVFKN